MEKVIDPDSNLSYFAVKKSSGTDNIIQYIFPLVKKLAAVKLSARPQIFIFCRDN